MSDDQTKRRRKKAVEEKPETNDEEQTENPKPRRTRTRKPKAEPTLQNETGTSEEKTTSRQARALLKVLAEQLGNNENIEVEDDPEVRDAIPEELPILPLKDTVVYPLTVFPLAVGQERSIRLIEDVVNSGKPRLVGLVAQKSLEVDQAGPNDSFTIGSVAILHKLLRVPDGTVRLAVQGIEKMEIVEYTQLDPYLKARVRTLKDEEESGVEIEALMRNSITLFQRLVALVPQIPDELLMTAINVDNPRQLAYLIATSVRMDLEPRQQILETSSVKTKLEMLNLFLTKELEVLELGRKIQSQVQDELSKTQREYFLREQLRAIQKELGEDDPQTAEIKQLREAIEKSKMPPEARKEAERELDRLSKLPSAAAEYGVIKTYLDWLVGLPWEKSTEASLDISVARQILDEDHYDLEKIKERILEYLAVRKLRLERHKQEKQEEHKEGVMTADDVHHSYGPREPILCFVGPPGVGKTSLGQSIARALGRKFTRMSLGGMRDEAEIRGHRRTYIGAMPGRIIQAIRRAESNDPVFMLDEVDKLGNDYRGDPSSALLEVLDPEQNRDFRDHYLDVPFDLSKVMFIATANMLDTIPAPLRDRMEILTLAGYTEEEKLHIAFNYLVPKQLKANALTSEDAEFEEGAIRLIINNYTREAGVRNLEREIANVCRKVARKVAEGNAAKELITKEKIGEYLGKSRFKPDEAEDNRQPGIVTGLAVTEVGGDILFIEATRMPGSKNLIVTGQLGNVMKESAQAALSYVRAKADELQIDPSFFDKSDIHIHIPAGAIPKDGPSAGITMMTAIASLLTGRPVKPDIAMTGEVTLRGRVLPIGGVKEKVLAAKRAGLKTIILPKRNEPDLDDLSPELRGEMTFILVDNVDEVLQNALETFSVYPPKPTLNGKNGTYPAASNKGKRKKPKATAVTD